jgi:hypothetical protein
MDKGVCSCLLIPTDIDLLGGGYDNAQTCHNAQDLAGSYGICKPVVCWMILLGRRVDLEVRCRLVFACHELDIVGPLGFRATILSSYLLLKRPNSLIFILYIIHMDFSSTFFFVMFNSHLHIASLTFTQIARVNLWLWHLFLHFHFDTWCQWRKLEENKKKDNARTMCTGVNLSPLTQYWSRVSEMQYWMLCLLWCQWWWTRSELWHCNKLTNFLMFMALTKGFNFLRNQVLHQFEVRHN